MRRWSGLIRASSPAAGVEQRLVPEGERGGRRLFGPDGTQERVALRQDAGEGCQVATQAAVTLGEDGVEEPATFGRRSDQQQHLFGREEDRSDRFADAGRAPRHPVQGDLLARLAAGARRDRELDARRVVALVVAEVEPHSGEVGAVAHEIGIGRRPVAAARDGGVDRLKEVRLAGSIRSGHDREARRRAELRALVAAESLEDDAVEVHAVQPSAGYDAVRTGMMTWT
jgi:hypothetical protein